VGVWGVQRLPLRAAHPQIEYCPRWPANIHNPATNLHPRHPSTLINIKKNRGWDGGILDNSCYKNVQELEP